MMKTETLKLTWDRRWAECHAKTNLLSIYDRRRQLRSVRKISLSNLSGRQVDANTMIYKSTFKYSLDVARFSILWIPWPRCPPSLVGSFQPRPRRGGALSSRSRSLGPRSAPQRGSRASARPRSGQTTCPGTRPLGHGWVRQGPHSRSPRAWLTKLLWIAQQKYEDCKLQSRQQNHLLRNISSSV